MQRRTFLKTGLGVAIVASLGLKSASAQLRSQTALISARPFVPAGPGQTAWRFPGARAVKRISRFSKAQKRARALEVLMSGGKTPESMKPVLRRLIGEASHYRDTISLNYPSGRMSFANDAFTDVIAISDVVAETNAPGWSGKSLYKIGWTHFDQATNTLYQVEEPDVCDNLLLSIYYNGVCIRDEILCRAECERLRREICDG